MTAPAPHGGQTNRERAAEIVRALIPEGEPAALDASVISDALTLAEIRGFEFGYARGRAEAAAKIEALAAEYRASGSATLRRVAGDLEARALAAELSAPGGGS